MSEEQVALLREIRDNQREAMAMQREAIQAQQAYMAVYKAHTERWARKTRLVTHVLVPIFLVAVLGMVWPWLRYLWWWITQ